MCDRLTEGEPWVTMAWMGVSCVAWARGRPGRITESGGGKGARLGDKVKKPSTLLTRVRVVGILRPVIPCHNPHPQPVKFPPPSNRKVYQLEVVMPKHCHIQHSYTTIHCHQGQYKMPRKAAPRPPKDRSSSLRNLKLERAKLEFRTFCMFRWQ